MPSHQWITCDSPLCCIRCNFLYENIDCHLIPAVVHACRFIFYTAYSPQSALTDWNLVFYSLLYTSLPTIVVGVLDKNLSHKTLLNYPPLYGSGQREEAYNQTLFWGTMLDTLWQSLVLFYVPFFVYNRTDVDLFGLGCLWVIAVVVLVNVHLSMDVLRWNWFTHAAVWGSVVITFLCQVFMDVFQLADLLPHYWYVLFSERV